MSQRKKPRKQPLQNSDPVLQAEDATFISSLSEPELDLLISLKQLAIHRSKLAGHKDISSKFDPRILRALGVILLEHFKQELKSTPSHAMIADLIDKLPLLSVSTPENINPIEDTKSENPIKNMKLGNSTTSFATMRRNHMHDDLDNTEAESSKKQKKAVKEEPVEY